MFTGIDLLIAVLGAILSTGFVCLFIAGATENNKRTELYGEGYKKGHHHGYRAGYREGVIDAYEGKVRDF